MNSALEWKQQPGGRHDGIAAFLGELIGLFGDMGDARGIIHVGPSLVRLEIFNGLGFLQRVYCGEPHAGFELYLANTPRIDERLSWPAICIGPQRRFRVAIQHATHVAVQALEHSFIDRGRAKFGPVVKEAIRQIQLEMFFQTAVGANLHAGCVADPQYDWHPIGRFVVNCGAHTLSPVHKFVPQKVSQK